MTCEELRTVSHLHLTPTDVLLSLASYDSQIIRSELTLPMADAGNWPLTLVGFPPDVLRLLQSLQAIAASLDGAATEIRKEVKQKKKKSTAVKEPAT